MKNLVTASNALSKLWPYKTSETCHKSPRFYSNNNYVYAIRSFYAKKNNTK